MSQLDLVRHLATLEVQLMRIALCVGVRRVIVLQIVAEVCWASRACEV